MQMLPLTIRASVFSGVEKSVSEVIWHGKKLCFEIKTQQQPRKVHSPFLHPITQNRALPPDLGRAIFQSWYNKGVKTISDLFVTKTLLSFKQLKAKFYVPSNIYVFIFFGFLHIRHFINSIGFPIDKSTGTPIDS